MNSKSDLSSSDWNCIGLRYPRALELGGVIADALWLLGVWAVR